MEMRLLMSAKSLWKGSFKFAFKISRNDLRIVDMNNDGRTNSRESKSDDLSSLILLS